MKIRTAILVFIPTPIFDALFPRVFSASPHLSRPRLSSVGSPRHDNAKCRPRQPRQSDRDNPRSLVWRCPPCLSEIRLQSKSQEKSRLRSRKSVWLLCPDQWTECARPGLPEQVRRGSGFRDSANPKAVAIEKATTRRETNPRLFDVRRSTSRRR